MKIVIVSHTYTVELNREKLKHLANLEPKIEVTVIVPKRWRPGGVQNQRIETTFYQEGSFQVIPVSNFSQNNQGLLTFGFDILPVLQRIKPQIIQVEQGSKSLAYAELIALNHFLGLKAKNLFFTWWNLPYQLKWPVSLLEAYNLNYTDGIIAGNHDAAEILRQRGYSKPIKIMPQLGVDETLFYPSPRTVRLSNLLKIQPQDFVIGFVGRFVEEKGLLTLGKALANLKKYDWKWLLVGRGRFQTELIRIAKEWGISDRLIWVESVPHNQIPQYINLMNVLVLPSETSLQFKTLTLKGWKEQFGHVLIEAMACQVPVIGSNSGEIPHVIGEAGLIFPEGNVEELRNCLQRCLENPAFMAKLGKQGWERANTLYTNQALARQLLEFYQELLS